MPSPGLPRTVANADLQSLEAVEERTDALVGWYQQLALHVGRPGRELAPLAKPHLDSRGEPDGSARSRSTIWLGEHLDHLADHLEDLIAPATHLAEIRRQSWWR